MSLEFLNYKDVLNTYLISDVTNIIIKYISHYMEVFDSEFIWGCIETGPFGIVYKRSRI